MCGGTSVSKSALRDPGFVPDENTLRETVEFGSQEYQEQQWGDGGSGEMEEARKKSIPPAAGGFQQLRTT